MENRISAVAVERYEEEGLREAVRRHFDALEVPALVGPGTRVVLKPNLLMKRRPEEGTTTHPLLVQAVALELKALGVTDIVIADSPGGPYSRPLLEGIYHTCGMAAAAQASGAVLNTGTGWQTVQGKEGDLCRQWDIIDPVARADVVINLPKLKTHAMTTLSGGVKNLFGCVPGLLKPQLHFRFPTQEGFGRMLVELAGVVKPALTIVDAVVAMEGDGPSAGTLRTTGMTFGARNVFALDVALCDFIGLAPLQVPMTAYSVAQGLAPETSAALCYLGDGRPEPVKGYRRPASKGVDFTGHLPAVFHRPARWVEKAFLTPRPVVRRRQCIGCRKCAESCAPKAVEVRKGKAVIAYEKCIGCYCCHEMCPVKAIEIRKTPLRF